MAIAPVLTIAAVGTKGYLKAGRCCSFLIPQLQSILVQICIPGSILFETVQFTNFYLTQLLQPIFVLLQAPAKGPNSTIMHPRMQMAFWSCVFEALKLLLNCEHLM